MATFPPAVAQAPPSQGDSSQQGGSPLAGPMQLAQLGQLLQSLSKMPGMNPQGIKMMLDGLRMLQSSAAANSSPQQTAAPPR